MRVYTRLIEWEQSLESDQKRGPLGSRLNSDIRHERRPYLRPTYPPYPVKYFAARDRAPAPNALAAALLPSSFRNKDFASFFSWSDTSA
jgi:hypothetical protein